MQKSADTSTCKCMHHATHAYLSRSLMCFHSHQTVSSQERRRDHKSSSTLACASIACIWRKDDSPFKARSCPSRCCRAAFSRSSVTKRSACSTCRTSKALSSTWNNSYFNDFQCIQLEYNAMHLMSTICCPPSSYHPPLLCTPSWPHRLPSSGERDRDQVWNGYDDNVTSQDEPRWAKNNSFKIQLPIQPTNSIHWLCQNSLLP